MYERTDEAQQNVTGKFRYNRWGKDNETNFENFRDGCSMCCRIVFVHRGSFECLGC